MFFVVQDKHEYGYEEHNKQEKEHQRRVSKESKKVKNTFSAKTLSFQIQNSSQKEALIVFPKTSRDFSLLRENREY